MDNSPCTKQTPKSDWYVVKTNVLTGSFCSNAEHHASEWIKNKS
jgi:hypothetical protein